LTRKKRKKKNFRSHRNCMKEGEGGKEW
jgi:hypothetical protein